VKFQISDEFMPATLYSAPMTDEEFVNFCNEYEDLRFEATAEGDIVVKPKNWPINSARLADIGMQLGIWARADGRGRTFASCAGFVLPNGARRSPDTSWIPKSRIRQIDPVERKGYWRLSPNFVIRLRTNWDRTHVLRAGMEEYMENGTELGWLIDPEDKSVTIYRPNTEPETRRGIMSIEAENPIAGFTLDLSEIWDPDID